MDEEQPISMSEDTSTSKMDEEQHTSMSEDNNGAIDEQPIEQIPTEKPPSRLMITKMVLENFKSYAGVKEIGPFHKCFSSVVGPNGSGKSNVIDAMLFVFGKRAKTLRLNKVSELIHNSSAFKNNPLEFARVSVHFQEIVDTGDGDDDFQVIPNTNVVVTRIARRDNSSSYKLNNKNCTFKDVAKYLDSKDIDLDNNRFLILQGEVEMISLMPPKGRTENDEGLLEYLEDIIGSNKFVEETKEVMSKVEMLTEQRQERLNRVKAVEKEKESLESAKLEAEALIGKEREIRKKKNILYQIENYKISKEINTLEGQNDELKKIHDEQHKQLVAAGERVTEIELGYKEQTVGYDKILNELQIAKKNFTSYERREIKLQEDIKHLKDKSKKLESKSKAEAKNEKDALTKVEEAETRIPTLESLVEQYTNEKTKEDTKLESLFEKMKEKTDELRKTLEDKTQELAPVEEELTVYQGALDTASMEVQLLEDSTTRAKKQLVAAEKELSSIDKNESLKKKELKSSEVELKKNKKRLVEANKEVQEIEEEEKKLATQTSELTSRAEEAKALVQSSTCRSKAVDSILKAKKGELASAKILGRLGDLASISEKYDIAVSTSCGMLDHIVVKSASDAQKCLEFLRKHNLGRANFIPLDKMKKGAHDRTVETPEQAPRLFDLITPRHHSIVPALFLAVGNTLVAPDLETASRWAYEYNRRWRVVTTSGQLIESSGTMSGGGKSVSKGRMRLSSKSSKSSASSTVSDINEMEDCKKLESMARDAQEKLQQCRNNRRSLVEEIRSLEKRIRQLTTNISKLSVEVSGFDTTREELTKRIPDLKIESELSNQDKLKLKELNKKVNECKSDMSECSILASRLKKEKSKLQKAIKNAGGPELEKQQNLCSEILEKLNETNKELSSSTVSIASFEKAMKKAKKAVETAERELLSIGEKLEQVQGELDQLQSEAEDVKEAYEKVKDIEEESRKSIRSIEKEYEEVKKTYSKLQCVEVETAGQMDNVLAQIKDMEKRTKHWKAELRRLKISEENDKEYISDDEEEDDDDDEESSDDDDDNEGDNNIDPNNQSHQDDMATGTPKQTKDKSKKYSKIDSLPTFSDEALQQYDKQEVKQCIENLDIEYRNLAKNTNMAAIAEYRKKEADYLVRIGELDEVTDLRNVARKEHEDLRRKRLEMFMDGFGHITLKLKEMYQMITLGGDAELELVDSLDPFSEGIVFSVRPPRKSWKNIANLSGGEKTLSSLALVFALHHYKPTPLYVMDEIDAALDFKNVSIVANYIKERTKNAQFIIISLRNNMFELADRLVGIYKTNNCTKSVTINPKAFARGFTDKNIISQPLADKTNAMG